MKNLTQRQIRRKEIREARQAVRILKPRYWYWCERYRALKRERRVLNRELRAAFLECKEAFLTLNKDFKEAGERLQMARDKRGHTSPSAKALAWAEGFNAGKAAAIQEMKGTQ